MQKVRMTSIQRKEAIRFVTVICLREKEKKRSHKKLVSNEGSKINWPLTTSYLNLEVGEL